MRKLFSRLLKNDSGSNALEYGVIAGLISVVCITAAIAIGPNLSLLWTAVQNGAASAAAGL